jgi:hypothetical protein
MHEDRVEESVRDIAAALQRFGPEATGGRAAESVAREWFDAGFADPEEVEDWLRARCFDASGAQRLESAGMTPEQAAMPTNAGTSSTVDTIGAKLIRGELSFDEARRIITNEFWNS